MAYFAREQRNQSPPRKRGIHVGGPVAVPPPKEMMTREQYLEQQQAAMNKNDGKNGGVLRYVTDSEATKRPGRNPNHKADNDIFGPPVTSPKPTPRVRTGVSDEELARIWAEDERKAQAAQRMERGTTLVDKMVAEPINPVIPSNRSKDAGPAPRKQINLLTETTEQRNRQAFEPAGFSGMGSKCKPEHKAGRSCKPAEEFIPPELRPRPKYEGRRTKFPKDTFSFQDEAQTQQ